MEKGDFLWIVPHCMKLSKLKLFSSSKQNLNKKLPIIVYIPFSFDFRGMFREQIHNATMTVLNSQ